MKRTTTLLLVLPVVTAGLGFAGGVVAAAAKKEIVVTPAADLKFEPLDPKDTEVKGPAMSVVFGDVKKKGQAIGFLLRIPAGGKAGPHTHTSDDYVVGITGLIHDFAPGPEEGKPLGPGGHWFQPGKMVHDNDCEAKGGTCLSFVYMPKGFDFIPAKTDAKAAAAAPAAPAAKPAAPAPAPAAKK
jgi:hypothetical protein